VLLTLSAVFFCASDAEATMGRPPRSTGVDAGSADVTYTTFWMLPPASFFLYEASPFLRMLPPLDL